MHIKGMTIQLGQPPFADGVDFRFDKHVNVFVGPNASGKSNLLRMLGWPVHDGYGNVFQYICQFAIFASEDWPVVYLDHDQYVHRWAEVPWVQIPAARLSLPWSEMDRSEKTVLLSNDDETIAGIFRHGYDWGFFNANQVEIVLQLLIDEAQSRPRDGGLRARRRDSGGNLAGYNLNKAVGISYRCAQRILSEIVTGTSPHNLVAGGSEFRDGLFITYPEVRLGMAVDIVDGDSVAANLLSSGTQSSLLWIRFLALQMLYHYDFQDEWEKQPAILLIDEIENHLHPTWQRRVIPALLEHFPGLQIFATTHSPFVVAGLKAGQVHLLNRDASGVVTASTSTEDIVGWTADEILRTMMGVQDPTDDETARNAAELRQLRDEGPRATPEEEEQRQAEMQRLRRLVNRDLLAGGPAAAQRELFEQQFAEALEKYQQSHDLSQENG